MIDPQRIHFNGQHAATGWPSKCKAFALSSRALHTALGALFAVVGAEIASPQASPIGDMLIGLNIVCFCSFRFAIHEVKKNLSARNICTWKETRKKVINVRPDRNALPSEPKWIQYAEKVKGLAAFELGSLSLIAAGVPIYGIAQNMPLLSVAIGLGGVVLPFACDAVATYRRWNKVIHGEWVVEDPKPFKQKAKEPVKVKGRFGVLVPDG